MQKYRIGLTALLLIFTGMIAVMVSAHEDEPPAPGGSGRPYVHIEDFTFEHPLTYYEDIKPILDANCVGCHIEGQISGDIPLNDPAYVEEIAEDIARVTWDYYMPPWMPGHHTVPLEGERLLSEEEIAMLSQWADSGAAMGDPANAVSAAPVTEVPTIRRDFVMQLEAGYLPSDANQDDYRCLMFDPLLEEAQYLTGYVFEPDQTEMVHHAIVYQIKGYARRTAENKNGKDGQPGWSCYNTTHLPDDAEIMVGTWTPGTFPLFYSDNTGYLIEPGDFFVLQIHYNLAITHVPDRSSVTVQYAEPDEEITPLLTIDLTAPVEIPCPEGIEGQQCDRDTAVRLAAEHYGSEFWGRPDDLLRGCEKTLADYEGMDASNAWSSCEFESPWFLTATGILGHMHELGKSFKLEVNPDTPEAVTLLDIPRWDFHWQDRYQFAEPILIKRGDVVRMTCVWDNTLSEDPRYIVWGEGTGDEMCFGVITVIDPTPR